MDEGTTEGERGALKVVSERKSTGEDSAVEVAKKFELFVPAEDIPLEDPVGE